MTPVSFAEEQQIERWDGLLDEMQVTGASTASLRQWPPMMPHSWQGTQDTATVLTQEIDSAAPWLIEAARSLAKLSTLPAEWDSSGAEAPNKRSLELARRVLETLSELDFEPIRISPSADDGVCISFRVANRYADIECFNNGSIFAMTKVDNMPPAIWEVSTSRIDSAVSKLYSFIAG